MEKIVTVIIPSYKRAHLLSKTLPSYLQEGVKELILVDDCSPDNTAEVVRNLQKLYPQIKYIRQPQNMKQPSANNRGLDEVTTEWVYFGDDDSILYPDSIKTLYNTCVQYNADICGATAYYMNPGDEKLTMEEYVKKARRYVENPQRILDIENLKAHFDLSYKEPIEVPFCHACLLMKSQLAQSVKFDPLYLGNAYREETDFIVRCAAKGAKVMYNSNAAQINLPTTIAVGGCRDGSSWQYKKYVIVNTWRFLQKNYSFLKRKYHLSKSIYRMQWDCIYYEAKRTIKYYYRLYFRKSKK